MQSVYPYRMDTQERGDEKLDHDLGGDSQSQGRPGATSSWKIHGTGSPIGPLVRE